MVSKGGFEQQYILLIYLFVTALFFIKIKNTIEINQKIKFINLHFFH